MCLEFIWRKKTPKSIIEKTYCLCGCESIQFESKEKWSQLLAHEHFDIQSMESKPISTITILGCLIDEGLNALSIIKKIMQSKACIKKTIDMYMFFNKNTEYIGYTILLGKKK